MKATTTRPIAKAQNYEKKVIQSPCQRLSKPKWLGSHESSNSRRCRRRWYSHLPLWSTLSPAASASAHPLCKEVPKLSNQQNSLPPFRSSFGTIIRLFLPEIGRAAASATALMIVRPACTDGVCHPVLFRTRCKRPRMAGRTAAARGSEFACRHRSNCLLRRSGLGNVVRVYCFF